MLSPLSRLRDIIRFSLKTAYCALESYWPRAPEVFYTAHVIIDGYNVIGIDHGDIAGQRERLVNALAGYRLRRGHDITLVFDGGPARTPQAARLNPQTVFPGDSGSLKVVYSGPARKADDVIKRILSERGRKWIVVTSDRDIASHAWAVDCVPVRSEDFAEKLYGRPGPDPNLADDDDEDDEENTVGARKTGNPRMLSKKEKLVKQALDKL
jgi:hypothetical protein